MNWLQCGKKVLVYVTKEEAESLQNEGGEIRLPLERSVTVDEIIMVTDSLKGHDLAGEKQEETGVTTQ